MNKDELQLLRERLRVVSEVVKTMRENWSFASLRRFDVASEAELTRLEGLRDEINARVREAEAEIYGTPPLRPRFGRGRNTTHLVIQSPTAEVHEPWIDKYTYETLTNVLCGPDIYVNAPYDVWVMDGKRCVKVIRGYGGRM